ncbi:hypothetical protein CK203_003017 [Vitis vinifera]|uniref:Uncharacterized protein n=1 Tax=Vitis vinifera TaxID=29760 RepID=A0A438K6U9_VITVI|nr:hypothetical protein CK203_003017 [Vitis vinifera]
MSLSHICKSVKRYLGKPGSWKTSNEALLPTKGSDKFKPFIRRLLEFKFCDGKIWPISTGRLHIQDLVDHRCITLDMDMYLMTHIHQPTLPSFNH